MAFAETAGYELEPLPEEAHETALRRYSAQVEELYWSLNYWKEAYFRAEYDYEDYAPAYCVGYTGCGQYGGSLDDADKSLCANFMRIRGDSRLTWEEARPAIRAAWERVQAGEFQGMVRGLGWMLQHSSEQRCTV